MAAGKKKPVRWTIPDVKTAPPRALEAHDKEAGARAYPSAAEMMARGPEMRAWLDGALRAIIQPVAVASALSIGATGCVDIGELLGGGTDTAPVFVGTSPLSDKPATLTPLGGPGTLTSMHPLPDKPDPATAVAPCPMPPLGGTALAGSSPAPAIRPPHHPAAVRGRIRPIRPPVPPPLPAVDPPEIDGDIAMVHPEPPPMPGGPAVVMPPDTGSADAGY